MCTLIKTHRKPHLHEQIFLDKEDLLDRVDDKKVSIFPCQGILVRVDTALVLFPFLYDSTMLDGVTKVTINSVEAML